MFKNFVKSIAARRNHIAADTKIAGYYSNPIQQSLLGYQFGSYDNNYASITRIAERFATVMPYAIDKNGEKIKEQPPIITALYHPNRQMSVVRFSKTLITMLLVQPSVQLLCWRRDGREVRPGGQITAENIAGFTFLEGAYRDPIDQHIWHANNQTYSDFEVVSLSLDVNPYAILNGYSPSIAAKKWSTVDDYIKEYEAGYFRNGAIPAGQMIVTAPSKEAFNAIVDELEKKHKGAGKNNNLVYTHRPTNELGEAMTAQLEWVPFSVENRKLSLKEIFDQSEKSRDMIFGVPAEVKGYLQNSNYASAAVAERIFDKYVVLPKLTQVYSDLTHEMNRITGGLGCAITFDFDMSVMAEEEKMIADTRKVQLATLSDALAAGFSLESAVSALGLPQEFTKLGTDAPKQEEQLNAEEPDGKMPDQSKKSLAVKNLADATSTDEGLRKIAYDQLLKQIKAAIEEQQYDTTEELDEEFATELADKIVPMAYEYGVIQFGTGVREAELIGLIDTALAGRLSYSLSDAAKAQYTSYLKNVAKSYDADTAASIRKVVERGTFEEWSKEELATEIRKVADIDEWRVQRLARTETHRASGVGSLDAMRQLSAETGIKIMKTFHLNPYTTNHCEECESLDGKSYELDAVISSREMNGFTDQETADVHPNCGCYLTYDIVGAKSVKVTCPSCGRYMFESKGGSAENVICANSKCKKHFDIEVANGKINAKERNV